MKHTPSIPMSRNQWDLFDRYIEKLGVSKAGVAELQDEIEQLLIHFLKNGKPCWSFLNNSGLNALQHSTQNIGTCYDALSFKLIRLIDHPVLI
ncbi:MAG: hypothetical protein PVG08_19205 [Desulfobacterales bacterium]|jgi:hypothetical protein